MRRKSLFAAGALSLIVACSSVGLTTPSAPAPARPSVPTVAIPPGAYSGFHHYLTAEDGSEVLVLSTVDPANYGGVSAATPLLLVKGGERGVADVTAEYFVDTPAFFGARNIVSFPDPATGQLALWVCSQGREMGQHSTARAGKVNGVWGEQDRLFVMQAGKFVDQSSRLPQSIDFSHGCAVANPGGDVAPVLVKNTLAAFYRQSSQSLLRETGNRHAAAPLGARVADSYWVGAADLAKSGTEDIILSRTVMRKVGRRYEVAQQLSAPDLEAQGYSVFHGGVVGDLDADGYPDLVAILSGDGIRQPFLVGARLAIFINDGKGRLVYRPHALPAHTPTEFGLDLRLVDIDFDGRPDIVTSGSKYSYGDAAGDFSTAAVLINIGDGTFMKKRIVDPALSSQCVVQDCQAGVYVLKGRDASSFDIVSFYNLNGASTLYGRKVTASTPLGLR